MIRLARMRRLAASALARRPSRRWRAALVCALALAGLTASRGHAAPATGHEIHIQGVARDLDDALVPSGDVQIVVWDAPTNGTAVASGSFPGAVVRGVLDVTLSALLDHEATYYLDLAVAGHEIFAEAAPAGRWRFHPGGGSRERTDLEARLAALENEMGLSPGAAAGVAVTGASRPAGARAARPNSAGGPAVTSITTSFTDIHGLLGLGNVSGDVGTFEASGTLLDMPIGRFSSSGPVQVELGPVYLFAPHPNPEIRFVRDVPGDQGRSVRVRWRNDLRERPYSSTDTQPRITSYTLYRRVGPGQAATLRASQAATTSFAPGETAGGETLGLPAGEWDVLMTVPATLDTTYQTVVPTLCDSNSTGICWSTFLVRSITDQTGIVHPSPVDSGYSVDNLAPGVPAGLTAQQGIDGTTLSWQASSAPDFQYFRVYRDSDPGFTPGPGNLIHATATTSYMDPTTQPYTYKVTALDFNGNESPPASATVTVGVDARPPAALAFRVAPNPFRGSLTLVIDVPEGSGAVELAIYDLAGRRVRTLVDGAVTSGRHALTWDGRASNGDRLPMGTYVARLTAGGRLLTRRLTLLR